MKNKPDPFPSDYEKIYFYSDLLESGQPLYIYDDHRWILPVIHKVCRKDLPVVVVTFDRHKDSLSPSWINDTDDFSKIDTDELLEIVKNRLSQRDDDWILSGMEMGIISDVVHFTSENDGETDDQPLIYKDRKGFVHKVFYLGVPRKELCFRGRLCDENSSVVKAGLWDILGWDPEKKEINPNRKVVFDIDLDFFTMSWDNYTLPFTEEMFKGEFETFCQSEYFERFNSKKFIDEIIKKSSLVTIAMEPDFCGSREKAGYILELVGKKILGHDFRNFYCSKREKNK